MMATALLTRRATVMASGPDGVEVGLASPCGGCRAGCGRAPRTGVRMTVSAGSAVTMEAGVPAVGTPVQLAVARRGLNKACVLVFGFPLAGWLVATALVDAYWGEAAASVAGLGVLAGTLIAVRACRATLRRWANIELIPLSRG